MSDNMLSEAQLAALTAEITTRVETRFADKEAAEKAFIAERKDLQIAAHSEYVSKMKESDEPWVEVVGDTEDTAQGIRVALEWNDAFIDYLRANGVPGADEDQLIQYWVTTLMQNLSEQMIDESDDGSSFT